MGPAISRLIYRLMGGRDSQTLSWAIGAHKDTNRLARVLYGLWPSHFDESLGDIMSKYEPGPLTQSDKAQIRDFQTKNDLKVDGDPAHETVNTFLDLLRIAYEKLQEADAKIMELTARHQVCSTPEDMGAMKVVILLLIGAFAGFLGAQVF